MKKNVLIFGGGSFLAKTFNEKCGGHYKITNVYRSNQQGPHSFNFETDNPETFAGTLKDTFLAVLFFQGINPTVGPNDMTAGHFKEMLNINIVTPALIIKNLVGKLDKSALVLFVSSVATKKGSYDPAYASSKSGLVGLMHSLANAWPQVRFNIISLGLVENSPVYQQMTVDYRQKHASRMFNNSFVKVDDVISVVAELINNQSINRTNIEIDGGYH